MKGGLLPGIVNFPLGSCSESGPGQISGRAPAGRLGGSRGLVDAYWIDYTAGTEI